MNSIHLALAVLLTAVPSFAQGQVNFANRVGANGEIVNAPVTLNGTLSGPGPDYTAQLFFLQGANGSLTPLIPTSSFGTDLSLPSAIRGQFWQAKVVDVPVQPGTPTTFVVGVWRTSAGSYDAARAAGDAFSSDIFIVPVGGGNLPPADLTTLRAFTVVYPEPSAITIGLLGAA